MNARTKPDTYRPVTAIVTEDGTFIITDPATGHSVSRRTRAEADAEVLRLMTTKRAA